MTQTAFHMPTPRRARVSLTHAGVPKVLGPSGKPVGRRRVRPRGDRLHASRPLLRPSTPVHVTMRLVDAIKNARKRRLYNAIRWATSVAFRRERVRIVHLSIQKNHVHAIVEAADAQAMSRGLQGFQISAARGMNAALKRKGRVFADRFHARQLTTPSQTRNAVRYVINNWRHHGLDRHGPLAHFRVDVFSSAPVFDGFTDYNTDVIRLSKWPPTYEGLSVWRARSWLLSTGWIERGGGRFSVHDVPA